MGKPKISEPGSCSSNTYVVAVPTGKSITEAEAKNMISYMTTRFFRFLVSIRTSTQDMPPRAYAFVPMQDFSKTWTDKELYEKGKLTEKIATLIMALSGLVMPFEGNSFSSSDSKFMT